jgi:hypothetical protein
MIVAILLLGSGEPAAETISHRPASAMSRRNPRISLPANAFIPPSNSLARGRGSLIERRASGNSATPRAVTLQLSFGKMKVQLE